MKNPRSRRTRARARTRHPLEVSVADLRWHCTPADLDITSMADAPPLHEIIGQDRAIRALNLGLEIRHAGYNIFVTGAPGTGRTTTIRRMLQEFKGAGAALSDKCYVHNFRDPDSPRLLFLPVGQGTAFKKDMAAFLAELLKSIPAIFESRRYIEQRKTMLEHFQDRQRSVLKDFEKRVKQRGFEVVQVQGGAGNRPEIAPVIDGNPTSIDNLQTRVDAGDMPREQFATLAAQQAELEAQMDLVMREMRNIERRAKKSIEDLRHKVVIPVVDELLEDLEKKYPHNGLSEYLAEVRQDIVDNIHRFQPKEESQQTVLGIQLPKDEDTFTEYQVNVLVDNNDVEGVPIILETNPRYKNLFGTIERAVDRNGLWVSDFTHIKAGSLVKADGGYLVLNAIDVLTEPGVWTMLKRVLRNKQIEIQSPEPGPLGGGSALKPEPINLNVKVIMVGESYVYHLLFGLDEDFKKIFKFRSDFDIEMTNDQKSIRSYVAFVKTMAEREKLLPFDVGGVTEVVEYGARLAERKDKLSTRFSILADVLREASYWAEKEEASSVTALHVRKAIDERFERVRMIEEKIQEMIEDGSILIDTEGAVVGQVNGLSVYQISGYEFGRPSRITAQTGVGRAGIVNIEREAVLSGPLHNKGVLILSGFLQGRYAQDKPLVLSASVAFEQSYSGVDGDSASSTELYALLSSLAGVPLRQDIAVTGSVNQRGQLQPIGGVNQKVEGFFDVCKARGLTGTQGVLIPQQNVRDLMLRHDVVEAVERGEFHLYSAATIDEGIALLTGKPAGTRAKNGRFTPGSINALVDARLALYAKQRLKFER